MAIYRSPVTSPEMTAEDYFEWELLQEHKHEYIDGEVFEMSGVSDKHGLITMNIIYALVSCLDRSRFTMRDSAMRVRVSPSRYLYPDLTIIRGHTAFADAGEYNLTNPFVVLEVTSPSSIVYDRTDKLDYYYDVPSIEACLIVDQHRVCAELHSRADYGWQQQVFISLDDVLPLPMLDCELPLDQVYRGISFERS